MAGGSGMWLGCASGVNNWRKRARYPNGSPRHCISQHYSKLIGSKSELHVAGDKFN